MLSLIIIMSDGNVVNLYKAIARLLHYSSNPSSYTISPEEDNKLHHLLNG